MFVSVIVVPENEFVVKATRSCEHRVSALKLTRVALN